MEFLPLIRSLIAGVAALALSASAVWAEPPGGKGGKSGGGHTSAAPGAGHAQAGHGQAGGQGQKSERPAQQGKTAPAKGGAAAANRVADPRPSAPSDAPKSGGPKSGAQKSIAVKQNPGQSQRAASQGKTQESGKDSKGNENARPAAQRAQDRIEDRDRALDRERILTARDAVPVRWSDAKGRGLVNGCPPGLAKKANGCMPPGLAKGTDWPRGDTWEHVFQRPDWWGYRDWRDGRARYYDGYLLRLDGRGVSSFIPLLGGALALGSVWPNYYEPYVLPPYYQDFYGLGPSYRYADNVLYRIDPETAAITSIAALLTGSDITIGQPLPAYYGIYNVPYAYRDRYADGPDALYRYNDGYIYRVDPETRLVQAAIELLM